MTMRQLSLSEARADLSHLVDEVFKGRGPIAISQRSKLKAILVEAQWYLKVEEQLSSYRQGLRTKPFRLGGTMEVTGQVDLALEDLRRELAAFLQKSEENVK
ncbi:MAG: type II toxin-antitoxin system Phd/YefM family antitoxin [Deltaproteobacteria bacterium]|nr:type II toxin-antitoxin system Phd/YefM family antitoxin [Deltaproteobacteria bacterium]